MLGNSLKNPFLELEEAKILMTSFLSKSSSCYLFVLYFFVTIVLSFRLVATDYFAFLKSMSIAVWISNHILVQTGGSLCRISLCNQIRHLYYVIRSSGTVAYTGVSSSSTTNANSQVSFLFIY